MNKDKKEQPKTREPKLKTDKSFKNLLFAASTTKVKEPKKITSKSK